MAWHRWCSAGTHRVLTRTLDASTLLVCVLEGARLVRTFTVPMDTGSFRYAHATAGAARICIATTHQLLVYGGGGALTASYEAVEAERWAPGAYGRWAFTADGRHAVSVLSTQEREDTLLICGLGAASRRSIRLPGARSEWGRQQLVCSPDGRVVAVWRFSRRPGRQERPLRAELVFVDVHSQAATVCPLVMDSNLDVVRCVALGRHSIALGLHSMEENDLLLLDNRPGAQGQVLFKGQGQQPAFDPSGRFLAVAQEASVSVLDGVTGEPLASYGLPQPMQGQGCKSFVRLAWHPDGLGLSCKAQGVTWVPEDETEEVEMCYVSLRCD